VAVLVLGGIFWVGNTALRALVLSLPRLLSLSTSAWIDCISCSCQVVAQIILLHDSRADPAKDLLPKIVLRALVFTLGILVVEIVSFSMDVPVLLKALKMLPFQLYLLLLPILMYQFSLLISKDFRVQSTKGG
jgi:hypothetical protein